MKLSNRLLEKAKAEAELSTHVHRMGAVIFNKKNIIISCGHNFAQRSAKKLHPKFFKWPHSIHAEMAAVLKAKTDLVGMNILIIRINKKGDLRLAKPCNHCRMYLNYIGIKNIYYSNNDTDIVKLEVNN